MDYKSVFLIIPFLAIVSNGQTLTSGRPGVCSRTVYYTGYNQGATYGTSSRRTCTGGSWFRRRRCTTLYSQTVKYITVSRRLSRRALYCCPGYRQIGSSCVPTCSPICQNGGSCIAPNRCKCVALYTGNRCQQPVCSPFCQNGGTCTKPYKCNCPPGWTGNYCQLPVCTQSCLNGGKCTQPNTCSCTSGWVGSRCQQAVCTQSCLNGGTCIRPNTCSCLSGWAGSRCHQPICRVPCQNGGTCTRPNTCSCPSGWTGANCQIPVCSPACLNGGTCTRPNTCSCTASWFGSQCQQPTCKPPCENGGKCIRPDTCNCPSTWSGSRCQQPVCSPSCQNGGKCIRPNTCSCPSGWTGSRCQEPVCLPSCRNQGTCVGPNTCNCPRGWTGALCQDPVCTPSCQNGGTCSSPFTCSCPVGWRGQQCQEHYCTTQCQNGGSCVGPNTCECTSLWEGSYCQQSVCSTACQNGGTCVGRNKCRCPSGWTGDHCQTYTCSPACANGGTCTGPNTCSCISGTRGSYCQTRLLVQLSGCPFTTNEAEGTVSICVSASVPFIEKTKVTLLLADRTAEVGEDYTGTSHQVVFSPGGTQACVSIPIEDDDECELTESFGVKLADPIIPGSYFLGQPMSCLAFIEDNEPVQMSFLQSEYAAVEEDDHVQVCVVSSCPCPVQTKVRMVVSPGTAVEGSDYPPQSPSVTLAVGAEEACTNVRVTNDVDPEDPETLEVALMNDEAYSIGNPAYVTITITDTDVICRHPPVLSGMEYVGLNPNGTWYSGSKVQFTCKTGYELLDSNGQYKGIQGDSTCSQSGWIFDSFCKDIKECGKVLKLCDKHCRELEGSYECFCDSHEKLDANGFSCIRECGHIVVPVGVNSPQITDNNGLQKAELSCTRTGYIFSGGKDPSPQFCFRGQWTYEFEDYDIPGCEAVKNSSASIGIDNAQPNVTCDPNEPVTVDINDLDSFFNFEDDETEVDATATCETDGRKRSTGHVVLHFTIHKPIPPNCNSRSCILGKLRSLRPAALKVSNAIKSSSLEVTLTTQKDSQTFHVNPEPVWSHIKQTCEEGSVFKDNQCVPCSPGNFYNKEENNCQFCPLLQYQDKSGQTSCKACPDGRITRRQGTNALAGCIVKCKPGHFSTEGDGYEPCLPCPDGSWQNETGASFCYACDYGHKTGREGAMDGDECRCPSGTYGQDCASTCMCENGGTCLENGFCACPTGWDGHDCSYKVPCPTGNFYNVVEESCQPCPVSQYQDQSGQISCKQCPDGKTTSNQGAVSSEECIEICLPGTFYDESQKSCELCPLSQYQDKRGQASCMACPNGKITRSQGTSSVEDCIGCDAFCHPGVECQVDKTGQVVCNSCPEGFTGNGVKCYPVCNGVASNVYLASYLQNYRAVGRRSVMLVSTDDTSVTAITEDESNTHDLTSGSPQTLEYSTSTKVIAMCTDTDAEITAIGINSESRSLDAFRISKVPDILKPEVYVAITPEVSSSYQLQVGIVVSAFFDNTEVEITIGSTASYTMSGMLNASSPQPHFTLSSMDYISISGSSDLTGAEIRSSKPVTVVSGHECANIPLGASACDHVVEQIPPVSKWGRIFILSTFARNVPGDIIKVVASENNVTITVDCSNSTQSNVILNTKLDSNEHLQFHLPSADTCILSSSSPVLVSQFSTGGSLSPTLKGDPSMTVVPSLKQFFTSGKAEFITPNVDEDYDHFVTFHIYYPPGVTATTAMLDGTSLLSDVNFSEIVIPGSITPSNLEGSIHIFKGNVGLGAHKLETNGYVAAIVYGYRNWEMYSYVAADF